MIRKTKRRSSREKEKSIYNSHLKKYLYKEYRICRLLKAVTFYNRKYYHALYYISNISLYHASNWHEIGISVKNCDIRDLWWFNTGQPAQKNISQCMTGHLQTALSLAGSAVIKCLMLLLPVVIYSSSLLHGQPCRHTLIQDFMQLLWPSLKVCILPVHDGQTHTFRNL